MSESGRKLNNPLLSASVTGGTYEEFAQNATLFPARQIPVPVDVSNVNQSKLTTYIIRSVHICSRILCC